MWGKENVAFLTCVSLAIAAGIVSKAMFMHGGSIQLNIDTVLKCIAVVFALALFHRRKNLLMSLFAGVGMAMLLKAVYAALVS